MNAIIGKLTDPKFVVAVAVVTLLVIMLVNKDTFGVGRLVGSPAKSA